MPKDRDAMYWATRVALLRSPDEIVLFDQVFASVFDEATFSLDPHARRKPQPLGGSQDDAWVPSPAQGVDDEDGQIMQWVGAPSLRDGGGAAVEETSARLPERLPSDLQSVAETPFDELEPDQLALLGEWLETAILSWPQKQSRRFRADRHGTKVTLRSTLSKSRRSGFEAIRLVRNSRKTRPRRVVMLCDVSQSMQPYVRAYLHLLRALRTNGDAEVFVFATTITRLTQAMNSRDLESAIAESSELVQDRFGGTRIAGSLTTLLRSRHGGLLRGAIVLVASDGWDSDEPEAMTKVMGRLQRLAWRVVWANPRKAVQGYEPLVGGMAAALPFCDYFCSAHSVAAMDELIEAIVAP